MTGSRDMAPQQVLLFSGHMIDAAGRTPQRFPADKEDVATRHISETLYQLHIVTNNLDLTQGACGDILLEEACLQRGVKLQLVQPFKETKFIENSVRPGGSSDGPGDTTHILAEVKNQHGQVIWLDTRMLN